MLWHFYGLQGGGKSWGAVVFAQDFHIKKGYKVFANFYIEFGEPLSIKRLMDYGYDNCVIIVDEAYGVADSHTTNKANDNISEVSMQSRKKHVEVLWITQLQGDLYKRIRESAHRKVECINTGTEETPILNYIVKDAHDTVIDIRRFDTETVRSAYHLFNTEEKIMPTHLNPELTKEKVLEIKKACNSRRTFIVLLNDENKFITKEIAGAVYDLLDNGEEIRAWNLIKLK